MYEATYDGVKKVFETLEYFRVMLLTEYENIPMTRKWITISYTVIGWCLFVSAFLLVQLKSHSPVIFPTYF